MFYRKWSWVLAVVKSTNLLTSAHVLPILYVFGHVLLKRKSADRLVVLTKLSMYIPLTVSTATAGRFALNPAIMWRCGQWAISSLKRALTAHVIRWKFTVERVSKCSNLTKQWTMWGFMLVIFEQPHQELLEPKLRFIYIEHFDK